MFILFLAPGGGSVASAIATSVSTNAPAAAGGAAAAGVSSFAAGIVGGLVAPIFDLLFPARTAVATIDGLPPELLLELDEENTEIPQILNSFGTTEQTIIGPPPFTGGQCPALYNSWYNVAMCDGDNFLGWSAFEVPSSQWAGPANTAIILNHPTLGNVGSGFNDCAGNAVTFTTIINGVSYNISGAQKGARLVEFRRSDGMPDNCGDPPGAPTQAELPNVQIDPAVIPPPIEFPPPPLPDEEPEEDEPKPLLPIEPTPIELTPTPDEIVLPSPLPDTGVEPPPEIEFSPPPTPVQPIPVPVIPTPTIPGPFVIPPAVPGSEPLVPPAEEGELEPLPEIVDEEPPLVFPPLPCPGQLTPEGKILIKLEECCFDLSLGQEECCDELLECFEEIKAALEEIEYQVHPPPPGDPSLQLKTSSTGIEVLVTGETDIIWVRPVFTINPNLNKIIQTGGGTLDVKLGSFLNYIVSGKFSISQHCVHADNFYLAPKRCTGFGLLFKNGAAGFAQYYVRIPTA